HPKDTLCNPKQEQLPENEEDEDEEITPDPDEMLMEEADWQLYAYLFPNAALPTFDASDLGHRPVDQGWDVDEARARWANVDHMASYIADQRREAAEEVESNDDMAAPIDVETLEQEQLAVFQRFIETYTKILQQEPVEPMRLNIDGTAGCGKTYLIRAICQELRRMAIDYGCLDPIRVLAPSGVAAWNINGRTIHSALSIPATNSSAFPLLMGTHLATLQQQFNGVHFLIVDEKSMLPPVGDRPLYAPPSPVENASEPAQASRDGATLYAMFRESFRLKVVHRQQGDSEVQQQFRQLLDHARNGGLSTDDWKLLLTRCEGQLPLAEQTTFKDAMCLFTTADAVETANLERLIALNSPCARIKARHDGGPEAVAATTEDAAGLEPEFVVARGAKVMITRNVWQQHGLVNGATGIVEDVVWAEGSERSALPIAVLVACPTYSGPTLWRTEPRDGHPDGVPIVPITAIKTTFEAKGKTMARTQLPLRLAWAFCSGLTFVALSRVKTMDSFVLVDKVDYSRVQKLGGKNLDYRIQDTAHRYTSA
ncbi:hypothetical protein V8D89_000663, partial [Ganoderma adspersum]